MKKKKKISFEIIHTKLRSAQKSYKIKGHTHYAVNRKAARACREALFFAFFAYREEKKKKDAVSFSVRCRETLSWHRLMQRVVYIQS